MDAQQVRRALTFAAIVLLDLAASLPDLPDLAARGRAMQSAQQKTKRKPRHKRKRMP